ncbi:MAG: TonB-dependent receptor [Pseudomonadota bacterium]
MQTNRVFRINATPRRSTMLAAASSLAMALALTPGAISQETTDDAADEDEVSVQDVVVVKGFRSSLRSAQSIKENAETFVDAITAEDIGALPDRSVAESLQRVPGVNIGRFEKTSDPDRFSVEGTGVIVRGLPFVRSELNGRDIFSATGGSVLSFNDVSPELLGRVEVFKNVTADMIEGGIAGTVNLVTRKPLDSQGFRASGTVGYNYGDLREEWSPEFSGLVSNTWETDIGDFGAQFGLAASELESRTDASQVTDPCYRASTLDGPCFRTQSVSSAGFAGDPLFDASNFPPADSVLVPKGAGVRTTNLFRDREAISFVGQWESPDGKWLGTFEWLNSKTSFETEEFSILALVNDDALFPVEAPGSTWEFDNNGIFQSGRLTQTDSGGYGSPFGGIPTEYLRFERGSDAETEDFSFDLAYSATDSLRFNFEAQSISSDLTRDSIIGTMNTWSDIELDITGDTPQVQFLPPSFTAGAPADALTSGFYTYYWFALDSREKNEGDLNSLRLDGEYDISDTGFFRSARFGARWAERDRVTRNTNFSTWGNLSAPWAGRAGCAPWNAGPGCAETGGFVPGRLYSGLPGQENATGGGAFVDEFPNDSSFLDPFASFQRGNAPVPTPGGAGWFFGGDDLLAEYLSGETDATVAALETFSQTPNATYGVNGRTQTNSVTGEIVECDPFCPSEISDVTEITNAIYGRLDFEHEFTNGIVLDGNFGIRYVETTIEAGGETRFPVPDLYDTPALDDMGNQIGGGNGDGIVQVSEVTGFCDFQAMSANELPGVCSLSPERQAEFAAAHTGEVLIDDRDIEFENWLPSVNAKLDFGNGWLVRGAVSKGISRPDLQLFRAGVPIGDNTDALRDAGNLETGPLFAAETGNRNLRPIESINYDLSVEWYWDDVGSLTGSIFWKDISGFVNTGFSTVNYTSPSGQSLDVQIEGPVNGQDGTLSGFELTYQQTYDMLPGLWSGLGSQITYTYVNGDDFSNPDLASFGQSSVNNTGALNPSTFAALQPLAGISEDTINATVFYEYGPVALRAAYNWRSEFLITPRDDIFPFSPIWQEATGQLDASAFYDVTDNFTIGIQGVNLLDEITETTQVVDFDGTRITRSAFRNDRRFTILGRFSF